MTTAGAPQPTAPLVLRDVEDLAESDLDADLAQRLEDAGWLWLRADGAGTAGDEVGRINAGQDARPGSADAVELAWAIRRNGPAATAAHGLGLKAAMLAAG
ncbi:hypothetical protein [Geodermatophilus sabuli]|uniref:Uncharacterized protein n=1 Tax=Geodermatophilus sabuli TaxID=1564158 RepID=A0A285EB80_9ACTN|nr:hypothetical protein [Geodermatophilus sabuli]MBB3085462.1 hypothetical protein [Geodermatophilus sabuli]SNX96113.1 hypothetical protein SAMN06893097_103282 [Geodermatophilus sabuli]